MLRSLIHIQLIGNLTLIACPGLCASAAADVAVSIVIELPADTPADAKLFVAGNLAAIGLWAPAAMVVDQIDSGPAADQDCSCGRRLGRR